MPIFPFRILTLLLFLLGIAQHSQAAEQPNIILLMADQLRYQSCGFAGDPRAFTPNIDRLAREGISYSNYVVSMPVCAATRATLWSGKYASSTGMVVNEIRMNPNQDCLAHVLSMGGYRCDYLGKWHLWANQAGGHHRPVNAFVPPGPYRLGFDDYWAAYNFNHGNHNASYFLDNPQRHKIDGWGPVGFTDLAIDRIRKHRQDDKPFAMVVSYSPPHDPWSKDNVPPIWYERFQRMKFELPATWSDTPDPRMDRNTDPQRWLTFWKPNLPEFVRVYYAMTAALDEQVGRILETLDETGLADNTIVVFTSDHGEQFGQNARVFKMTFYDPSARVPMLVRWPKKIAAGQVSDACMSSPDVMPTLLGLVGLPVPKNVEGADLSGVMLGRPGKEPEYAYLQGMGHTYLWRDGHEWRAIRDKRYTYAKYLSDGKELLYDNMADPQQAIDLVGDPKHANALTRLRKQMQEKRTELNDTFQKCSWYRDRWTTNRVITRGARGPFHRTLGPDFVVDPNYSGPLGKAAAPSRNYAK